MAIQHLPDDPQRRHPSVIERPLCARQAGA